MTGFSLSERKRANQLPTFSVRGGCKVDHAWTSKKVTMEEKISIDTEGGQPNWKGILWTML